MKVVCFLLTVLPAAVVGQPSPCPTRKITDPYQDMYKDMLFPDRDVKCCRLRIASTSSPPGDEGPPIPGDSCLNAAKTCFFGSQTCPDGSIHPTTRSDCLPATGTDLEYVNSAVGCPLCPEMGKCNCGPAMLGAICGSVMEDAFPAGAKDGIGDVPIPQVTITLIDDVGVTFGITLSDSDGCFIFEFVPKGAYSAQRTNNPGVTHITGPVINIFDSHHHTARKVCFLDQV